MTATANLPVLYDNVLYGIGDAEFAGQAFLWAADTCDQSRAKYAAEAFAREASEVRSVLQRFAAPHLRRHGLTGDPAGLTDDLTRFVVKRLANLRFGGNVRMWWERTA